MSGPLRRSISTVDRFFFVWVHIDGRYRPMFRYYGSYWLSISSVFSCRWIGIDRRYWLWHIDLSVKNNRPIDDTCASAKQHKIKINDNFNPESCVLLHVSVWTGGKPCQTPKWNPPPTSGALEERHVPPTSSKRNTPKRRPNCGGVGVYATNCAYWVLRVLTDQKSVGGNHVKNFVIFSKWMSASRAGRVTPVAGPILHEKL